MAPRPRVSLRIIRRFQAGSGGRDQVEAVECARDYARWNRRLMMEQIAAAVRNSGEVQPFNAGLIVHGKGSPESFCSCSHGAGRAMSRNEAKRRFTVEDHMRMAEGLMRPRRRTFRSPPVREWRQYCGYAASPASRIRNSRAAEASGTA